MFTTCMRVQFETRFHPFRLLRSTRLLFLFALQFAHVCLNFDFLCRPSRLFTSLYLSVIYHAPTIEPRCDARYYLRSVEIYDATSMHTLV